MKFILLSSDGTDDNTLEMKFEAVTIDEVLEKVDLFLRGTGFIPEGILEYTKSEDDFYQEEL